jgi:zinc/manganese transport system permease protein
MRRTRNRGGTIRTETATIGAVQATGLAAGFLFLSLNHQVLTGPETLLFGSFLGVSQGQVVALLVVGAATVLALAWCARPLLLSTLDRDIAQASGLPVTWLDTGFLLILALAVGATSQITGALLVFALLVAPAAAAQQLTMRPMLGLALSVGLALLIAWLGLGIAYFSIYPSGFFITTFAFGLYVLVRLVRWAATRR